MFAASINPPARLATVSTCLLALSVPTVFCFARTGKRPAEMSFAAYQGNPQSSSSSRRVRSFRRGSLSANSISAPLSGELQSQQVVVQMTRVALDAARRARTAAALASRAIARRRSRNRRRVSRMRSRRRRTTSPMRPTMSTLPRECSRRGTSPRHPRSRKNSTSSGPSSPSNWPRSDG